jgi:hypothetical protein
MILEIARHVGLPFISGILALLISAREGGGPAKKAWPHSIRTFFEKS